MQAFAFSDSHPAMNGIRRKFAGSSSLHLPWSSVAGKNLSSEKESSQRRSNMPDQRPSSSLTKGDGGDDKEAPPLRDRGQTS